jgi:glycosyltransferase involved in cell wall biosynthesis
MKLTLIGPVYPYRGGIAWFTTSLGHELLSAGHQVQIISFSRQYPAWLYPGKSDKDPSQQHVQVSAQYLLDPIYLSSWKRTIQQIKQFEPKLVIIQWWTTFWAPAFWVIAHSLRVRRIPASFIIHNVMPHEARFYDRFLVRETLKKGSALIYLSPQEGERLKTLLPGSCSFSAKLPLFSIGSGRIDRREAREKLSLSNQDFILLFFGLIRPYKGLDILIKALGILRKQGTTPVLLIVGEFWESLQSYQQLIEEQGLSERIRIVNQFIPNEEVVYYFSAADAFVAPYIGGTQSASIKVAMNYQLPILASDRIVSDLPQDNYPFLIHPAGDINALALSILKFIEEPPPLAPQLEAMESWKDLIKIVEKIGFQMNGDV